MSRFADLVTRLVELNRDLVRNIKSIRAAQDLLDDLSADPEDWRAGEAAVARSGQPPLQREAVIQRPFDYGSVITYPFVHHNGQATRFSDGLRFGVWYGSFTIRTTIYETVHHWLRFVEDAFPAETTPIIGERRVFDVRTSGLVADLRGRERDQPALVDPGDYGFCQQLGRYAVRQRLNGLLVRSARCRGTNAALFNADLLSRVRDRCYLTYRYRPGDPHMQVEREPGKRYLGIARAALRDPALTG